MDGIAAGMAILKTKKPDGPKRSCDVVKRSADTRHAGPGQLVTGNYASAIKTLRLHPMRKPERQVKSPAADEIQDEANSWRCATIRSLPVMKASTAPTVYPVRAGIPTQRTFCKARPVIGKHFEQ